MADEPENLTLRYLRSLDAKVYWVLAELGELKTRMGRLELNTTAPVTTAIARMIAAGTPEGEILARVVRTFPDLTPAELSAALQDATASPAAPPPRGH
jgi:uncharacterized protein (DUF433 family)